jgi:beta-lactamase class A
MNALRILVALTLVLVVASPAAAEKPDLAPLEATFKQIVSRARGKVGVALIHLESGATLNIRGDERFPMASVVKLPIALEVLKQVAERKLTLDRDVWIGASDIRPCCSIERRHPNGGISRTVGELLELSIIESDNTAADALLKLVGGPDAVEKRLRALGFTAINVDRYEGQLLLDMAGIFEAPPPEQWTIELQRRLVAEVDRQALNKGRAQYLVDERDTATPYETAQLLGRLQLANLLPPSETGLLVNLLIGTTTGPRRLKGRLPEGTIVAHKTGTTAIVINDVGIITLPAYGKIGGRLAIAVYVADGSSIAAMERTVAQLSAAAFEFFSGVSPSPRLQSAQRKLRSRSPRRTN